LRKPAKRKATRLAQSYQAIEGPAEIAHNQLFEADVVPRTTPPHLTVTLPQKIQRRQTDIIRLVHPHFFGSQKRVPLLSYQICAIVLKSRTLFSKAQNLAPQSRTNRAARVDCVLLHSRAYDPHLSVELTSCSAARASLGNHSQWVCLSFLPFLPQASLSRNGLLQHVLPYLLWAVLS
jgi:hypothetical protein